MPQTNRDDGVGGALKWKCTKNDWNRQKQSLPIHEWGFDLLCTIMATQTILPLPLPCPRKSKKEKKNLQHGNGTVVALMKMAQQSAVPKGKNISGAAPVHFIRFVSKSIRFAHPVCQFPVHMCVCVWRRRIGGWTGGKYVCGRYILAFYVNGCDPFSDANVNGFRICAIQAYTHDSIIIIIIVCVCVCVSPCVYDACVCVLR